MTKNTTSGFIQKNRGLKQFFYVLSRSTEIKKNYRHIFLKIITALKTHVFGETCTFLQKGACLSLANISALVVSFCVRGVGDLKAKVKWLWHCAQIKPMHKCLTMLNTLTKSARVKKLVHACIHKLLNIILYF